MCWVRVYWREHAKRCQKQTSKEKGRVFSWALPALPTSPPQRWALRLDVSRRAGYNPPGTGHHGQRPSQTLLQGCFTEVDEFPCLCVIPLLTAVGRDTPGSSLGATVTNDGNALWFQEHQGKTQPREREAFTILSLECCWDNQTFFFQRAKIQYWT